MDALGVSVAHEWTETANFEWGTLSAFHPAVLSWWELYEVSPGLMAKTSLVIV